ncbi:MAG: DsbA family protein [Vulcanococcus sp.]
MQHARTVSVLDSSGLPADRSLPPDLQSSRIVVVSDFNCPYCFTLNAWLNQLGVVSRVFWVGVEHKPHLPLAFSETNRPDDVLTLQKEVSDVMKRAPEVGVELPPVLVNSHQALLLQAAVEADQPELAAPMRTAIFERFWRQGRNIAELSELTDCERLAGVEPDSDRFLDLQQLERITSWWRAELDRIPCMLAPSGARHLGLQDKAAVEAFVLGALHEPPPGPACR